MANKREAKITRKTKETDIDVAFDLDGNGNYSVKTDIPFFNHLLESFSRHGRFDVKIRATGDTSVDYHHLVEDTGITMGDAFNKAVGNKGGIKRFASCYIPMDEALVRTCLDISGRPFLRYNVELAYPSILNFDAALIEEFFRAFAFSAGITLHVDRLAGSNAHHIVEAVFKSYSIALHEASRVIYPENEVPSTKGSL
ncbi:MAG TPA: imidazoleglycerol-phosphate dehydratase HisB [Spirochaetes bacterium]|nr:imidazoleglycerol-phosphate dehydratase HisB [Spirochaetota bacterium]